MLLVVVGHSLTELVLMDSARGIYTWIYLFHMPFFVLISGYTARNFVGSARQIRRLVSTLIVPYLIVETSLQLITRHYDGEPEYLMLLSPQWLGWFLAALLIWRLSTPIWRTLKYPITVSILVSLTAGLIEIPNVLALPKVLGLLPFYVIGMNFRLETFRRLGTTGIRIASALLLSGTFIACQIWATDWAQRWPRNWLLWKARYDELGSDWSEGLLVRTVLLLIGFVLTLAALSLIPRAKSWTTVLGSRTFYCYLLHGYVILFLDRHFDLWEKLEPYGAVAVIGCVLSAILLANLLMTKPVATAFKPVFEPELNWLFRTTKSAPIKK